MIWNENGIYKLKCDICGEEVNEQFFGIQAVIDYQESHAWKHAKKAKGWMEICQNCYEGRI